MIDKHFPPPFNLNGCRLGTQCSAKLTTQAADYQIPLRLYHRDAETIVVAHPGICNVMLVHFTARVLTSLPGRKCPDCRCCFEQYVANGGRATACQDSPRVPHPLRRHPTPRNAEARQHRQPCASAGPLVHWTQRAPPRFLFRGTPPFPFLPALAHRFLRALCKFPSAALPVSYTVWCLPFMTFHRRQFVRTVFLCWVRQPSLIFVLLALHVQDPHRSLQSSVPCAASLSSSPLRIEFDEYSRD